MEKRLRQIFGSRYETLTYGEVQACMEVLRFVDGSLPDKKNPTLVIANAIAKAVVVATGLSWNDISGRSRRRDIVNARAICFSLMKRYSDMPKSSLAGALGIPRDHATVLLILKSIDDLMKSDRDFRYAYNTAAGLVKKYLEGEGVDADNKKA